MKKVLLLGLSNKPNVQAFDSTTNSGKIIDMLIHENPEVEFVKANLVSFAPLDDNNKLRYPNKQELFAGATIWKNKFFEYDCIILFGKKVQDTILNDKEFVFRNIICVAHPCMLLFYSAGSMGKK